MALSNLSHNNSPIDQIGNLKISSYSQPPFTFNFHIDALMLSKLFSFYLIRPSTFLVPCPSFVYQSPKVLQLKDFSLSILFTICRARKLTTNIDALLLTLLAYELAYVKDLSSTHSNIHTSSRRILCNLQNKQEVFLTITPYFMMRTFYIF